MRSPSDVVSRGSAVILAAGMGTRMRSRRSKVLHPALGRPIVHYPVAAAQDAGLDVVVVVHHQEDEVRAALAGQGVGFARQEAPRGTGDAVASALDKLPPDGVVVVLCGDGPLIRAETLTALLDAHGPSGQGPLVTVMTVTLDEPGAYGRLVRDPDGQPLAIVEASEATADQLAIQEVNSGIYAIDLAWLRSVVPGLAPHPPKGEIYLTDVVGLAADADRVAALVHDDQREIRGVNDRFQLAQATRILQDRLLQAHLEAGVGMEDPASVTIEPGVTLDRDVFLERGVVLRGTTTVGEGVEIEAHTVVINSTLAPRCRVRSHSHLESATVGTGAIVGPYARLRPAAVVGPDCRVGNFVEIKKSTLAAGAKVNHLSYVGDATVGAKANVGAGTITCNYDGFGKHHTSIGAGAFIGSNSALVAPVTIGDGAIVGAGSVVVRDVAPDALAVARGEQRAFPDGGPRFRARAQARKAAHPSKEQPK